MQAAKEQKSLIITLYRCKRRLLDVLCPHTNLNMYTISILVGSE